MKALSHGCEYFYTVMQKHSVAMCKFDLELANP